MELRQTLPKMDRTVTQYQIINPLEKYRNKSLGFGASEDV